MPSRDIENIANLLELLSSHPVEDPSFLLGMVSNNLRALAEQVNMLEDIPLNLCVQQ